MAKIYTRRKTYNCERCDRIFSYLYQLNAHRKFHMEQKGTTALESVTVSVNVITNASNQTQLEVEGKARSQILIPSGTERLPTEQKAVSANEKPYKCSVCQKVFRHPSGLRGHERTHTGERPYKCDSCDKTFALYGTLRVHKRIHTGETPYACNQCEKKFRQSIVLKEHIRRTHNNGEKSVKCGDCGKVLASD